MKTIEELQADLKQLYADLEERRIMEQESVPQTVNFDELSSRAERYKIKNHPMSGKDEREQEMYLLVLLSVIALDDNAYEKSFSLLYRISHGMGVKGDVQEVFLKAQQMNFNNIDEITRMFINDNVRLVLLMECIMISQSFKKEKKKATEYITELCVLMKLEKEQIILISNIARVILTQDIKEYKCNVKNTYEVFDCYIYPLEINRNIKIVLIRKNCNNFTSHEYRRVKTYQGKVYSNDFYVLDLKFSGQNGSIFKYSYPERIDYVNDGWDSTTTESGKRTIDLFNVPDGYECVFFRENISDDEPFTNILIAVTTNAPNLAYSLAMKRFNEAQNKG